VDGRRNVLARNAGRRIVGMVHEDQTLSKVLTRQALENAVRTLAAIGGSTNAVDPPERHRRAHRRAVDAGRLRPAGERYALRGEPAAFG
jgi:hypothetical protein